MQPEDIGQYLRELLVRLLLSGMFDALHPQTQVTRVFLGASIKDEEDSPLTIMGCRLDSQPLDPSLPQRFHIRHIARIQMQATLWR
jgi:hypothetical protein